MAFDGSNGARKGSQGRRSYSRPSSAAHLASSTDRVSGVDASEPSDASLAASKRGRKPFDFTEEVDHGILRIYNTTDVPFDTLAKASEKAGGPRKLWLRKRLTQITGTKCMDMFRLDKPTAEKRKQRQLLAMGSKSQPTNDEGLEGADIRPVTSTSTRATIPSWTAQLEAHSTDASNSNQDRPPSLRDQAVMWKPRRPSAYSVGGTGSTEHADRRGSLARLSTGPTTSINRTPTAPNPAKRTWTEATNDGMATSYGARRMQTRRVSMSAITQRLEDMTGHTGLFYHINRISVQSHLSPRFPSSRFSWASNRRSAAVTDVNSPNSPNAILGGPIPYTPDPDYETFYHNPDPEQVGSLQSQSLFAMAALTDAKAAAMSDEEAEAHLHAALDGEANATHRCTDADERGVTALHLAAAYGYPRVCRYLMENGASASAYTKHGSSVCRFARPAQDFVKNDNPLYHRILYCRQWICVGRMPPVATETPISPTLEEVIEDVPSSAQRITSTDGSNPLPTLQETPNDNQVDLWQMPPSNRISMPRHSILTPLNTDTQTFEINRPVYGLAIEQQQFSNYERSPISVRICREDHNSLLTPNSFSPDVVFWPDVAGPIFPAAEIPLSHRPTSSVFNQYQPSQTLNTVPGMTGNDHPISPSSYVAQYDQGQDLGSGANSALEQASSYEWMSADDRYQPRLSETSHPSNTYTYTPNRRSINDHMPGLEYQDLSRPATSQAHYPTPPIDSQPIQQHGWLSQNGDLISATSLALEQSHFPMEQSHFPNMLWSNPAWEAPSRNDMFQNDPQQTFHGPYSRISSDQMFYD